MSVVPVVADSPADRGGIVAGDIIVSVEEEPVEILYALDQVLAKCQRGSVVTVEIYRGDEVPTVNVTLRDRPR